LLLLIFPPVTTALITPAPNNAAAISLMRVKLSKTGPCVGKIIMGSVANPKNMTIKPVTT